MSQTSEQRYPGLVWPGILVLVVGAFSYWTIQSGLETSRPKSPDQYDLPPPATPVGIRTIHARVWEDPLVGAVKRDREEARASKNHDLDHPARVAVEQIRAMQLVMQGIAKSAGERGFVCLPVLVSGGPYASDREARTRTRYAVTAALAAAGYRLRYPNRLSYLRLPLLVTPRLKQPPVLSNAIVPMKLYGLDEVRDEGAQRPKSKFVLVLWIDESRFGFRPLQVLAQILSATFAQVDAGKWPRVRIIGPASSDTLLKMADELAADPTDIHPDPNPDRTKRSWGRLLKRGGPTLREQAPALDMLMKQTAQPGNSVDDILSRCRLYSPRATVAAASLQEESAARLKAFVDGENGLEVRRVVGDDAHLVSALRHELTIRGAWPTPQRQNRTLVLVTERDTLYGRAMVTLFRRELADSLDVVPENLPPAFSRVFTYLRGIDGRIPGAAIDEDERKNEGEETNYEEPRAESRSQYDYLHRLRSELEDYSRQLKNDGNAGITCIGVVGSDVYDKLLVLRALRAGFPEAVFFTTDLHAPLAHEDEFDQTRNLVVASHFGLRLNENLQRGVGSFRDCYQTAAYLACLLAVDDTVVTEQLLDDERIGLAERLWEPGESPTASRRGLQPLVHEIGRSGPYQLTRVGTTPDARSYEMVDDDSRRIVATSSSALVHPASPRELSWTNWRRLLLGTLCIIGVVSLAGMFVPSIGAWLARFANVLFRSSGRSGSRLATAAAWTLIGIAVLLLVSIGVDQFRSDGEPFTLTGISIWPTLVLRLTLVILVGVFVVQVPRRLEEARLGLRERLENLGIHFTRSAPDRPSRRSAGPEELLTTYAFRERLPRISLIALLWTISTGIATLLTTAPRLPARGILSYYWGHGLRCTSEFAAVLAFFLFFDVAEHARRLTRNLVRDCENLETLAPRLYAEKIKVIAVYTNAVGKQLAYPVSVLGLLTLCVLPILDYSPLSITEFVAYGTAFGAVVVSAVLLRHEARVARERILNVLRERRLALELDGSTTAMEEHARLQTIAETVSAERHGAYRPWFSSPIVQWLLLGGAGSVVLIESLLLLL